MDEKFGIRRAAWLCVWASAICSTGIFEQPVSAQDALKTRVRDLVESVSQAEVELSLTMRRSKIIRFKKPVFRTSIADPSIMDVVAYGTKEVEIIGKLGGKTTMTIWAGDQDQPDILSMLVTVERDDAPEDLERLEYGELQDMVNELYPNSKIQLFPVADKLIVRGQARDEQEADQIVAIISQRGQVQSNLGSNNGRSPHVELYAAQPFPGSGSVGQFQPTVINLLKIPGEKQIMLKVRIAQLSRSAARRFGARWNFKVGEFTAATALATGGNNILTGVFGQDSFQLILDALETNGSAKILAEPNLVTISGRTATFLSGGQFAVPTVVGVGGAQAATTTFKSFGTQINFTPTLLDKDRIRLQVNPSFSTINPDNTSAGILGLDIRTVSTTVDLREGQVLAIAGLLQEQQRGDTQRLPFIGRIPLLNTLTANRVVSREETELMIIVSPDLVHPLEANQAPSILPGMEVTEPSDREFYLYGSIEGCPDQHYRSTVYPIARGRQRRCEKQRKADRHYLTQKGGFSK